MTIVEVHTESITITYRPLKDSNMSMYIENNIDLSSGVEPA